MLTPIPLVVRVLVLVKGIVQVAVVGDVMSIVEGDPAGAVTTVGVFEKSFRVPVEELTTKPWLTVTTVPPRSGWNGLLPFVLIDAGSFTWRTNWDNVVVPRNGMLKVATLKLPEPPMVVTFEADDVRSVLELPVTAPEPLALGRMFPLVVIAIPKLLGVTASKLNWTAPATTGNNIVTAARSNPLFRNRIIKLLSHSPSRCKRTLVRPAGLHFLEPLGTMPTLGSHLLAPPWGAAIARDPLVTE
jgi:hypothetical protein